VTPAAVTLGAGQTLTLPLTGKGPITRHKAFALSGGQSGAVSVAVDGNGNEVDADSLIAAEESARRAKYGKRTVDLYNKVQLAPAAQKLQVSFWLHVPDSDIVPQTLSPVGDGAPESLRLNTQAVESLRNAAHAAYAKSTANVKARFLAKLRKLDPNATDLGDQPYFAATLASAAIAALEADLDVDTIDVADRQPRAQLNYAKFNLDYNRLHAAPVSLTGNGVKVAQVEPSAPLPASSVVPDISPFTEPNPAGTGCADDYSHMARVASVLGSSEGYWEGVAPNINRYIAGKCNTYASDLETQATAAKTWGAVAINNSWGIPMAVGSRPTNDDKFFDSLVFSNRLAVVFSAGNSTDQMPLCRSQTKSGIDSTGMVFSPGLGFNVITVGGADYQVGSTYPNIWPCSAWKNPGSTNGDRNKPEVIAPAAGLTTLEVCSGKENWDSYTCDATGEIDGTSLSAPFVTGTAALLLQSAPVMWPETVKAIMMAAAQPLPTSDRDHYGAGLVNIGAAGDIVRGVNGNWRGDTPPQCGGTWPYTWPMYLIAGKQTRLAIAWTQDPNYNQYANQPQADLDLWVLDPQGNQFQSQVGNSWDNNYEFIDFVPPQTGTYKISVSKYRCDYTFASNRIGLAWHQAP
jgi:hypothetical protein